MSRNNTKLKLKIKLRDERIRREGNLFDMSQRHLEICEKTKVEIKMKIPFQNKKLNRRKYWEK